MAQIEDLKVGDTVKIHNKEIYNMVDTSSDKDKIGKIINFSDGYVKLNTTHKWVHCNDVDLINTNTNTIFQSNIKGYLTEPLKI